MPGSLQWSYQPRTDNEVKTASWSVACRKWSPIFKTFLTFRLCDTNNQTGVGIKRSTPSQGCLATADR